MTQSQASYSDNEASLHLYALTARKMGLEFHMAVYNCRATFQVFLNLDNKSIDLRDTMNEQ